MPVALLAGAFGQGNLGDEALLEAFVQALPGWRLVVTTRDPAETERLGCVPVPSRQPAAVARRALSADAVVVGGGTVFKTLHPTSGRRPGALLANTAALVAMSSATRHPVAMVGVGAGPLDSWQTRAWTRSIVRHANLLILRDEESAVELTGAHVPGPLRVGADPAWTLLGAPGRTGGARTGSVRIVPSTQAAGPGGTARLVDQLADTASRLAASGIAIELQAWQRAGDPRLPDDAELAHEVIRRIGSRPGASVDVVPTPASLPDAAASLAGVGAVLSYRFHALLAAASAGVPSVAVVHETKLGGLARRLEQPAVPVDVAPADLAALVAATLCAPGPDPAMVTEQIVQAHEGFRLLRVLLAGGRSDEADALGALPLSPLPAAWEAPGRSA